MKNRTCRFALLALVSLCFTEAAVAAQARWDDVVRAAEKEGEVTYRTLVLKDGGKIKEKLTEIGDVSYAYEIIESPLPVENYKAKLWLEVDDEPDRSVLYWQADFDAKGSEDDAKKLIADIFAAGLKGIKQQAIAASDAREGKTSAPGGDKDDDNGD